MTAIIAIIGSGNMGSSLLGGLIKDGHPAQQLWAIDPDANKLTQLHQTFGIHTSLDNLAAANIADVIVLAVKPASIRSITEQIAPSVQSRKPLVISIAAGVREKNIQQWFGGTIPIVRAMPNTPALIGCGATALYANDFVTAVNRNLAESVLRAVGVISWVEDEYALDAVTALSGSGPAYFFYIMEILQQCGVEMGLHEDMSNLLTLQTALGSARMALESDSSLQELRRKVTSKGGTTEKAISVLETHNIQHIFKQALLAAKERSEELASILGEDK